MKHCKWVNSNTVEGISMYFGGCTVTDLTYYWFDTCLKCSHVFRPACRHTRPVVFLCWNGCGHYWFALLLIETPTPSRHLDFHKKINGNNGHLNAQQQLQCVLWHTGGHALFCQRSQDLRRRHIVCLDVQHLRQRQRKRGFEPLFPHIEAS